jgi:MFS family permease
MREPAGRGTAAPARDERPPIRDGGMWTLAGGSSLYLTAQIAFTGFVVLFLHIHRGVSTHAAAAVLATMNLLGIAARILAGRWSDRLRARVRPLRRVGLALAVATVVAAALVDAPLWVLVPAFLVAGVLGLSWNGLSFTAAAERAGAARAGAALGLQQTSLAVVGALVSPAFAALVAGTSWRLAFAVAAAGPLLGALALRRVPEVRRRAAARSLEMSAIPPAAR